jgi:uncharacterized membrane protein
MPLTYQPFANAPEIPRIDHEFQMNVPDNERVVSGVAGIALVVAAFRGTGLFRLLSLAGGVALLTRGVTGRCPFYDSLGMDRRHSGGHGRGSSHRGVKVEDSIEIACDADRLYRFWRNLEQLPRVMRHVKSVEQRGETISHWRVAGPLGHVFEWDAAIINDEPSRMIAWESLPGPNVMHVGSVWFEPRDQGFTRVKVSFELHAPFGIAGNWIAETVGASPQDELAEDLRNFKSFAERELAPSTKIEVD